MKRVYETPMVEKLAFCYRDQVVAASGASGSASSDNTITSTPSVGEYYGNEGWSIGGSCKLYGAEALDIGLCDYI